MKRWVMLPFFCLCWDFAHAQQTPATPTSEVTADVLIHDSKINLGAEPAQEIKVEKLSSALNPTLETAIRNQANIQSVPTPTRGANLSLNGLSGEQVAVYWDGDPVLGRMDGALDMRSVSLGTVDRIAVYQGLDSLPYGSQNIAGVISLESPWAAERRASLRSAAGSNARTLLEGKGGGNTRNGFHYQASASNWRNDAIPLKNSDSGDTLVDSTAKLSASALGSKLELAEIGGQAVDTRLGVQGFQENSKGVLFGQSKESTNRRIHVFSDTRRGKSVFHLSYNEYQSQFSGLGVGPSTDTLNERAVRVGPNIEESVGSWTILAGSQAELQTIRSTRVTQGSVERRNLGSHAGARYALNENWAVGAGTRWDTDPQLLSPRAEVKHSMQLGAYEHVSIAETGLGFREPTAKELYLDFPNSALRYRIVGNTALDTERAWMSALRHNVKSKRLAVHGAVFQVRVRDAIALQPAGDSGGMANFAYSNVHHTVTYGAQAGSEYNFTPEWQALVGYQFLRGRNIDAQSDLFMQPRHRVSLGLGRNVLKGASVLGQATWTGKQGFFDFDRNGRIDGEDWARSFWSTSLEAGYGFKWPGVSELTRVFARVDNALNIVHEESLPVEPRSFLMGASLEL